MLHGLSKYDEEDENNQTHGDYHDMNRSTEAEIRCDNLIVDSKEYLTDDNYAISSA